MADGRTFEKSKMIWSIVAKFGMVSYIGPLNRTDS